MNPVSAAQRWVALVALVVATASFALAQTAADPHGAVAKKSTASSAGVDAMPFSDQPNFIVSGVTDWTAVGGHGSDATLRTSEDLARVTSSLSASKPNASAIDSAVEAKLRTDLIASPHSYQANLALGKYYLHQGEYQRALPGLHAASVLSRGESEAEYDLALACQGLNDLQQAKLHLREALSKKDTAEYHLLAGVLAESSGDPYTAVQQMQQAVQMRATEEGYFVWASELLLHRAVWQAVGVFQSGVAAYPISARMKTGLGSALFAAARYEEAATQLCNASDLQPDELEPYVLLGKIDEAAPEPPGCIPSRLSRFLQLQPGSAVAHYLYAMAVYRWQGESSLERVQALLVQAVAIDSSYAAAYLQLGIFAAGRRQYSEAIDLYKKALAADPGQPEAHYRLAVAYDHTHQANEARHERVLHEFLKRRQADAVEQQRRSVKQFVTSQTASPQSTSN